MIAMKPTIFDDTIFGIALRTAKKTIWRFFLTICFILLVYLLNHTVEAIKVIANLNCIGLLLSGTVVACFMWGIDYRSQNAPNPFWGEIIGFAGGLIISIVILLINESTLQQIGTVAAPTFIIHYAILYLALTVVRVAGCIIWNLRLATRPIEKEL